MAEAKDTVGNDMTHETTFQGTGVGTEATDAASPARKAEDGKDADAKRKEAEAAQSDASAKRVALEDLRIKAAESKMTDEERAVAQAEREADDAASKAAELAVHADARPPVVAGDVAGHPVAAAAPEMGLGDHRAQRFGNIPANPKPAKGEHADPEKLTTRMLLRSPNSPVPQEAWVHPDMVGDYARAGWELV